MRKPLCFPASAHGTMFRGAGEWETGWEAALGYLHDQDVQRQGHVSNWRITFLEREEEV